MEHNGEPLPDDLIAEILSVTGGEQSAQWWTGPSVERETQLTDESRRGASFRREWGGNLLAATG